VSSHFLQLFLKTFEHILKTKKKEKLLGYLLQSEEAFSICYENLYLYKETIINI